VASNADAVPNVNFLVHNNQYITPPYNGGRSLGVLSVIKQKDII